MGRLHSIARPPPIGADLGGTDFLHVASGALSSFSSCTYLGTHNLVILAGVFNLGCPGYCQKGKILTRGYEVGKCPDCGVISAASIDENGKLLFSAARGLWGKGRGGTECPGA